MSLRIVNWNLKWASPTSETGQELTRRIKQESPEVVCLTEAPLEFLGEGHVISAEENYGYANSGNRRKVQLWSRRPWSNIDTLGDSRLPSGRFIRGTTETSLGEVTFVGVCIPWKDAHVRTGRRDRKCWEDHIAYLSGLTAALESAGGGHRLVLLGDFNQRIPRIYAPLEAGELLNQVTSKLMLAREGHFEWEGEAIDHVFHSADLGCEEVRLLDNSHRDEADLSDHLGWSVLLSSRRL